MSYVFEYEIYNGECTVTSYHSPSGDYSTPVVIPEKIEGLPVTSVSFGEGAPEYLVLSKNVKYLSVWNSPIQNIDVVTNNPYLKSIDGNLYTKDGKTLLEYCIGRRDNSFVVPDGVEVIGNEAFWGAPYLSTVTLPESLTSIDSYAFECSGLANLILLAKTPPVLNDISAF